MGYFTFTDASVEHPRKDLYGYHRDDIIGYDGYVKVICPDNTEIEEECYEGYGRFGGKDIYELVTDWNRTDLKKIFSEMPEKKWGYELKDVAILYGEGASEEEVTQYIKDHNLTGFCFSNGKWKRSIGITIASDDDYHKKLRYPIKLTTKKRKHGYDNLFISFSTQ
jgi:hypothetical protein